MVANKAKKPVKNTTVSDCGGIKPEKLFSPKDENKSKPPKNQGKKYPIQPSAAFRWRYFYTQKEVRQYAA